VLINNSTASLIVGQIASKEKARSVLGFHHFLGVFGVFLLFGKMSNGRSPRKCFIFDKVGCWSTNHTTEEREAARQRAHCCIDQYFTEPNYREDNDEDLKAWFIERDKPRTYNI
jgi:hypothetical protein